MSTPDPAWSDLQGNLPSHQDELQVAHGCLPTMAEQDKTHGVGIPAVDLGPDPGTVVG